MIYSKLPLVLLQHLGVISMYIVALLHWELSVQ